MSNWLALVPAAFAEHPVIWLFVLHASCAGISCLGYAARCALKAIYQAHLDSFFAENYA